MNPLKTTLPIIHLKPGDVHFSERPELVSTILGSCVSIIMYNRRFKISAICHSQLPTEKEKNENRDNRDKYKYLDTSFYAMCNWFIAHGVKDNEIILKAFGGGDVLQVEAPLTNSKTIGHQNISSALRLIESKNFKIAAIDLGGESGRKIFFYTHTGDVLVKRMKK